MAQIINSIRDLISPPQFSKREKTLNFLINLMFALGFFYFFVFWINYGLFSTRCLICLIIMIIFGYFKFMLLSGSGDFITPYAIWTAWLITLLMIFFLENGLRSPGYSAFLLLLVVFAYLLEGRKTAIWISAGSILIGGISIILERAGWAITPPVIADPVLALIIQIIHITCVISILNIFGFSAKEENLSNNRVYAPPEILNNQLETKKQEIGDLQEELQAFIYSVSHDLRAPLRAMISFSDILQEDYGKELNKEGKQYLERINSSGIKMGEMLNDMLILSRINSAVMNPARVQLAPVAEAAFIKELNLHQDREIVFHPAAKPTVTADVPLIEVVITQLISNAVKFTKFKESAHIEFGMLMENNEETYYIKDNGIGFKMEYATKAFEPFQRLHSQKEFSGSGIGLTIVKRVIKRHGGRVWIHSTPDVGTTVYFTLPKS